MNPGFSSLSFPGTCDSALFCRHVKDRTGPSRFAAGPVFDC